MTDRRVVITGVGVVTPLGRDRETYFDALLKGDVGVGRITAFDPSGFPSQVGGEVGPLPVRKVVPKSHRKATKLMSRDIELSVVAADAAVRDAGLRTKGTHPDETPDIEPARSGVNIGAGLICCDLVELGAAVEHAIEEGSFSYGKWGRTGMESLTPLWLLKYLPNMLSCHASIIHDLQGPSNSVTCGEASGLLSVGEAYRTIRRGKADLMIAGGAESKINAMGLLRQCLLGRASTHYNESPGQACRPFDKGADGTVIAEGAAILVLETLEGARARGGRIYAELRGFGASVNFSRDFLAIEPDGRGVTLAIEKALKQAGVGAGELDLLVPYGTGIAANDRAELAGIGAALGEAAGQPAVLAVKSRLGNCGAGSPAIDLASAVLTLDADKVAPLVNCPDPVEASGLNLTNGGVRDVAIRHALTCCYTYGGQTAAMVISKVKG